MASLPARRPSQRRQSPPEQSQSPSIQSHASPIRSRSEDSQTIFINKPDEGDEAQRTAAPQPGVKKDDSEEVKKCWICFADSDEDTPESSAWRDPCPCALVAHEDCLLDWIADAEAPKNSRNRGITAPKIQCPQCKTEIKLARPRDYLVDAVRGWERVSSKIVTPSACTVLGAAAYNASLTYGAHSIYAVFGSDDGYRILKPILDNASRAPIETYVGSPVAASQELSRVIMDHLVHWRLYTGLPLVGPMLIMSRTSLADGILPVLPVLFFASRVHSPDDALDFFQWPPSASFAYAVLPYVRSLYNFYYKKVWAEKEKRWLKEIQPRTTQGQDETAGAGAGAQANPQQPRDDENVFEVRIDGGIWEDWEEDDRAVQEIAANEAQEQQQDDEAAPAPDVQRNRPLPNGGGNEQGAAVNQPAQQNQQPQAQPPNQQAGAERRLTFSPTAIAENVLGALLFPTIAGLTGEALKLVLPTSWTHPPAPSPRFNTKMLTKGFLQQKWARSLVGGCLFVLCKDALMLYVRWKMAQMHRRRRVVDFDRRNLRRPVN